jgi:hypothetical protein
MLEIKNLKDLRAQVGKPILLGYGDYPNDCFCWMGILKEIGERCEKMDGKALARVCKKFVKEGITDYVSQLCLYCENQVCIYDGEMRGSRHVAEIDAWYGTDWTGGGDADFLRVPTERELKNYYKKVKEVPKMLEALWEEED